MSYKSRWLKVIASAYCPCTKCCGEYANGRTATGRNANLPGVAVDPKIISLGDHVDIPHYPRGPNDNGSWILADDVGGAIKGNKIDVRFRDHEDAVKWGRKEVRIRVWSKE